MGEDIPQSQERRDKEFALKERELKLREKQAGVWCNPVFLGLIAATLALSGNMYATWSQNKTAERQAHLKAQSDLIVEAIKTGDPKRAAKNLLFLIQLGLIDDSNGRMKTALSNPEEVPVLPAPRQSDNGGYGKGGYGADPYGGKPSGPPDKN
jgi:hypothetical protein